jgi:hypothetical protein
MARSCFGTPSSPLRTRSELPEMGLTRSRTVWPSADLRLSCPPGEEPVLLTVRNCLGCTHPIRRSSCRCVLDVYRMVLLRSLVVSHGLPPGNDAKDARLPRVPPEYHCHLARGLLAGEDCLHSQSIPWTGPPRVMAELEQMVRSGTGVPAPLIDENALQRRITWSDPAQAPVSTSWVCTRFRVEVASALWARQDVNHRQHLLVLAE